MGTVTNISRAQYSVGDLIHHRLFDYRGVIVDVDRVFQASDDWYEQVARSRPPKNKPWYHILVHGSAQSTYVAERNLETDDCSEPIVHPMLGRFFSGMANGKYTSNQPLN